MFLVSAVLLLAAATVPAPPKFVVPNFRDTTVKTRQTYGVQMPRVTTLWLRGARERTEHQPEGARFAFYPAEIVQCDQRTIYRLNIQAKTYTKFTGLWIDPPERVLRRSEEERAKKDTGPDVIITIDSVDTGERREMGSYQARRIKTAITVEPSKGASTPPSKTDIEGWYIDLTGLSCHDDPPTTDVGLLSIHSPGHPDHIIFKYTGNTKRGFAVEETSRKKEAGNTIVNKTELLEFSDQPLDPSLFEPPQDFTQVQPGQNHRLE
jgi:hypothetical protein